MKNCPVVNFWDDYKSRAKLAQNRNRLFCRVLRPEPCHGDKRT